MVNALAPPLSPVECELLHRLVAVALELRAETCNAYDDHPIKCVALSPHGCSIVSSSSLGTIRVWGSVSDLSPSVAEHEPDVMLGTSWSQVQELYSHSEREAL